MYRLIAFGLGLFLALSGRVPMAQAALQDAPPPLEQPAPEPQPPREVAPPLAVDPQPAAGVAAPEQLVAVAPDADRPVKPLTDGPLHEAFLSPAKDREPFHIDKSPPAPIVERPGVDAPSPNAQWIEGYWDWDRTRKDFVWVTGSWRVPPPGRFWVNGYWKRDDRGWYRVPGFWSDRKTDRIDFRKNGPPADHPPDEPGASPGPNYFYVPGTYVPDGDGVVWKPGFWAKFQPGWAWVPAQWVHQPEGWTFQEGYWDRTLEDRGTLFAPAQVASGARSGETVYQPYTQISPQTYGLLYGAFGRPNAYYDGYPGCYYDSNGRYYGYADYGILSPYYGYLDYPYYGSFGYPYITYPQAYTYGGYGYGYPGSYGLGYGGYGYGGYGPGLLGGTLSSLFGFGYGYPYYGGLYGGFGYPYYGLGYGYPYYGLGYGGLGYGGLGYGGLGYGGLGYGGLGYGLGFGGLGFGGFGFPFYGGLGFPFFPFFGGFGYPFYGGFGFGFPAFGRFGFGRFGFHQPFHHYPFFPNGNRSIVNGNSNRIGSRIVNNNINTLQNRSIRSGSNGFAPRHNGVMPPPSSRPFANPFHNASMVGNRGQAQGLTSPRWNAGYNGVHHAPVLHTVSRPSFSNVGPGLNHAGGLPGGLPHNALQGGVQHGGNLGGLPGGGLPGGVHHGGGNLSALGAGAVHQNA
ncbi:MAG: YXWGXW repeat-containing protein, partial [Singulisphaera sp.]|nr:YXWGXW repeat-containing protein [Singulisphaera sp.]